MSLYGFREMVDNRVATLVTAADTVIEYTEFCDTIRALELSDPSAKFNEIYTSSFLDHMRSEYYKGFKHSVLCFYHDSEEQRDEFVADFNIVDVKSTGGRDRQNDMLHTEKLRSEEENMTEEEKNMTIEERFGLDKDDPWDRRSEEEKAQDEDMKKKMKDLQKKGQISGDSFGGADDQRASRERFSGNPLSRSEAIAKLTEVYSEDIEDAEDLPDFETMNNAELARAYHGIDNADAELRPVFNDDNMPETVVKPGNVHVDKISTNGEKLFNEDGSLNVSAIEGISATKYGGEVDEDLKTERETAHQANLAEAKAGKRSFSPDDFAEVLRGDGRHDSVVGGSKGVRPKQGEGITRPSLSKAAEDARRQYQEEQEAAAKNAEKLNRVEEERQSRKDRDQGIFRGAALDPDGERVPFEELPEDLRTELEGAGLAQTDYPIKNYPHHSALADRALFPFDTRKTDNGYRVLGGANIEVEGTMQMGDAAVAVVKKKDPEKESIVVYRRTKTVAADGSTKTDITLVRLR